MPRIKVALVGVGNCASALVQGLQYYAKFEKKEEFIGLRNPTLGGYYAKDIQIVAAFDIDSRKVGKDVAEAIFAQPNDTPTVAEVPLFNVIVNKGPIMDGVGEYTKRMIQVSSEIEVNVAKILKEAETEIVINLLPSGAAEASQWYAKQALIAGCAFVNTTPNFIANDKALVKRFEEERLPLAGDDLIDQVGSTTLHKTMLKLLSLKGVKITETYQLDVGGGTESLDTLERTRNAKRAIKTQSVAATLPYKAEVVAGSTDYVDFLQNRRDSYFSIKGVYFYNTPMHLDLKFSTVDAPNAGSVLFDVIRAMRIARYRKLKGIVTSICVYAFKRPPQILPLEIADEMFINFVNKA